MSTLIKGPAIFLAQFAGDEAPFTPLDSMAGWAADLGHPVSDDAHGGWSRNPEDGRVVCHCNGPGAELIPSNAGWTGKAAA